MFLQVMNIEHHHNKSLVIGPAMVDKNGHPMTIYLNEIVSKNSNVSNNIIVVSNEKEMQQVKNTLESSNSSFMSTSKPQDEVQFTSPKTQKNVNGKKPNYLLSKHSIVENKPEELIKSFDKDAQSEFGLKFPDVGVPSVKNIQTVKNMDKNKKNYIKYEEINSTHFKSKLLPSINTKKDLHLGQAKRTPKNRDLSMTVIKTGRLALQDEHVLSQDMKKNSSMSRDPSKKKNTLHFPLNRKEA